MGPDGVKMYPFIVISCYHFFDVTVVRHGTIWCIICTRDHTLDYKEQIQKIQVKVDLNVYVMPEQAASYPVFVYQDIGTGNIGIIIVVESIRERSSSTVQYYHTVHVLPCPEELHP